MDIITPRYYVIVDMLAQGDQPKAHLVNQGLGESDIMRPTPNAQVLALCM